MNYFTKIEKAVELIQELSKLWMVRLDGGFIIRITSKSDESIKIDNVVPILAKLGLKYIEGIGIDEGKPFYNLFIYGESDE